MDNITFVSIINKKEIKSRDNPHHTLFHPVKKFPPQQLDENFSYLVCRGHPGQSCLFLEETLISDLESTVSVTGPFVGGVIHGNMHF